jgi:hypothetical protein
MEITHNRHMKPILIAAAATIAIAASPAHAVKCGPAGAIQVFNGDGGYVFFVSKTYGDAAFMIPGRGFAKDAGALPGSTQFSVDAVHYQFLTVPKAKFIVSVTAADDASVLARHAKQEHRFALNAGSKFTSFEDLGTRSRPGAGARAAFLFKLWTLRDPKKPDGASQHMLSTVIGDEVALLSAIVPDPAHEKRAMLVFERFAASYRFLDSEKECPPATEKRQKP